MEGEAEREIYLLFHLLKHSLVAFVCALMGIKPTTLAYWDDAVIN